MLAALELLEKLTSNILRNPFEAKYRKVKAANKVFSGKIGSLTGSKELMEALGFVLSDEGEWLLDPTESKWNVLVGANQKITSFKMRLDPPPLDPSTMNQAQMMAVFQAALTSSSAAAAGASSQSTTPTLSSSSAVAPAATPAASSVPVPSAGSGEDETQTSPSPSPSPSSSSSS